MRKSRLPRKHKEAMQARLKRGECEHYNLEAALRRVQLGIEYYDKKFPGWEHKVDLNRLWMNTPTACIRAQVEGFYDAHMRRDGNGLYYIDLKDQSVQDLIRRHEGYDEPRQLWEWERGMGALFYKTHWERAEEFDHLEHIWREEIEDRLNQR